MLIVTILGGSSMSTPAFAAALAESGLGAEVKIRLAGRDRGRLNGVARACRLLASDVCIETFAREDWSAALKGADIVLIQTRIGGQRARALDETVAMRSGVPADEGLGAGGLCCAARTWPQMRTIFRLVRRHAPDTLTILLTSPAGLLLRLAAHHWPAWKIYGICELPYTTLLDVCARLGYRDTEIDFAYTGVNHLGFFHSMTVAGKDLVTEYGRQGPAQFASVADRWHAIPLKYLRFHFERARVIEEQTTEKPRGAALAAIEQAVMDEFAAGDISRIKSAVRLRPAPWYRYAVVPFLAARVRAGTHYPFFLSTVDTDGTVREKLFSVSSDKIEAAPERNAPAEVRELTSAFVAYENLAAHAIQSRELARLRNAWSTHPWADPATVDMCASEIWNRAEAAHREINEGSMTCLN